MAAVTIHARNTDYGGPVLWFVDSRRIDEAAMATNKRSSGKDNVQQRTPRTERSAPSKRANEAERPKGRKIVEPRDQKGIRPGSFPGGPSIDGCF